MSRQSIPPAARDILVELAQRLRRAPEQAAQYATNWAMEVHEPKRHYAYEVGALGGIVEGAANDLERLLEAYAPTKGPRK